MQHGLHMVLRPQEDFYSFVDKDENIRNTYEYNGWHKRRVWLRQQQDTFHEG